VKEVERVDPSGDSRELVQRGRPQRRSGPRDLCEQLGQTSLVVGGEEESEPVSVDAPHDRFDVERRPIGRVEMQPSDVALTEPFRWPHLGPPATHVDGLEKKDASPGFHDHGPRDDGSRVPPELSGQNLSPIEVDVTDGGKTALFQCRPSIHVSLLGATP